MHHTCWAMLSLMTMFPIWSSSCASEVMVVVAVATFSTLLLHMRRSSSQSASPALLHGATRKPGGGDDDCTPSNSLTGHGKLRCVHRKKHLSYCRRPLTEAAQGRLPWLWPYWCWCQQGTQPLVHRNHQHYRPLKTDIFCCISTQHDKLKVQNYCTANKTGLMSYHNSTPPWRVKRIRRHFLFLVVMNMKGWMVGIRDVQEKIQHWVGRGGVWTWKLKKRYIYINTAEQTTPPFSSVWVLPYPV